MLQDIQHNAAQLAALLAWGLLAVLLVVSGLPLALSRRRDRLVALAVSVIALGVRLLPPRGALDFAEATRVSTAWEVRPSVEVIFVAVPALFGGLRSLGVPTAWLVELAGPLFGAAAAGATYLLARAAGFRLTVSLLAAVLVAASPAHIRYSTGAGLAVAGATLWTLAFTVLSARDVREFDRLALSTVLLTLGVYARPEGRLLLIPAAMLTFAPGWTWRLRIGLGCLVGALLVPYAAHLQPSGVAPALRSIWQAFFVFMLSHPVIGQGWLFLAGLAGFAVPQRTPAAAGVDSVRFFGLMRGAFALTVALLVGTAFVFASEDNPLWGEWRYLVGALPFGAVGAAALADRVLGVHGNVGIPALIVGACALGLLGARDIARPTDFQTEYAYVRESAPRMAEGRRAFALITKDDQNAITFAANPTMAIATQLGPQAYPGTRATRARPCGSPGQPGRPALITERALVSDCIADFPVGAVALFLGLHRPKDLLASIEERFVITPIEERVFTAAPTVPHVNTQCPMYLNAVLGPAVADCEFRLGWYRLEPRGR